MKAIVPTEKGKTMKLFDANEFLTEVVKLQALSPEQAVAKIILLLSDMNGVDAVPVVRCKDCKFGEMCSIREAMACTSQKGFCWRGERKGDGTGGA